MTHTSTEQPSLAAIIHDLRESHARTSPGAWGKGATTHETVSRAEGHEPYKVAEFRHANDAQFCDLAHVFVPRLLSEIEALQSRVQEMKAERAAIIAEKNEYKYALRHTQKELETQLSAIGAGGVVTANAKVTTAKVLMTVELEYDADVVHGDDEEGKAWFFEEILSEEKGLLLLHSNEICDTVGKIRVLSAAPSNIGAGASAQQKPNQPSREKHSNDTH